MNEPKNIALENVLRSPHRSSVMQPNSRTSNLSEKIALVTGGTGGIGLATTKKIRRVVFSVQKALPLLSEGGSVVLNASTTSVNGAAAFSIYSASKTAVRNLARSWILNLKGRNIRINVISPGVVPTPGYDGLGLTKEQIQGFIDFQENTIPSGRAGTPEEIAKAVTFLASDDSSFVNGIELFCGRRFGATTVTSRAGPAENELKVRATDVWESLKRPPN
jgi:NAD(P)-dependent dehydrogenase (short-subunit alcohol dehydrogenase family)